MSARNPNTQSSHDTEIARLERNLKNNGNFVGTNPNGYKNWSIKTVNGVEIYPDLLIGPSQNSILQLIEVETQDSVNEKEAREQWSVYATARPQLIVHVPVLQAYEAKRLIAALRISATVTTY